MTERLSRRAVLGAGVALGLSVSVAGCNDSDGTDASDSGVGAEPVASGFAAPLGLEVAPGDDQRLYVVDQVGTVQVVGPDGTRSEPFLDVTDRMVELSGYEERGLLGLAFHPEFQTNGRLFVRYSAPLAEGMPSAFDHSFVLAEYRAADGRRVDPDSERRLLELPQPQHNHNSGSIVFGPDGYLYVGVGDGGNAHDVGSGHVDDWYDGNRGGNGQDVTANLLGSVLRINVDDRRGGDGYGIPTDNPLVDQRGLDEQYAWGFRNPWGMSFDENGRLFVADVGQNSYEEVDIVRAGGNYGWNVREGTHCFSPDTPDTPPESCPAETPSGDPLLGPIVEYAHSGTEPSGISIIGGYYDTSGRVEALHDRYVFADWQSDGRLFVATEPADDGLWQVEAVPVRSLGDEELGQHTLGFGRDDAGAIYVLTTNNRVPDGATGTVHRLVTP